MLNGGYPCVAPTESRRQSGVDNVGRRGRDWLRWAQVGPVEDDPGVTRARAYCHPNVTTAVQSYTVNADRLCYGSLPKQPRQTPEPIGKNSLPPPSTMVCNILYPDVTDTAHTHEANPRHVATAAVIGPTLALTRSRGTPNDSAGDKTRRKVAAFVTVPSGSVPKTNVHTSVPGSAPRRCCRRCRYRGCAAARLYRPRGSVP